MALQVFGLTGGIGSGKSAAARRLRSRGLPVVDADQLAREVVAAGSVGLEQIRACFGPDVLTPEGVLDRPRLGARVFADPDSRRALDQIVHPLVRTLATERFQEVATRGEPLACYEVPLLFEVGLERIYHPVVVVNAPLSVRLQRLKQRDGSSEAQAMARISSQMPLEEKARRADYVIDNSGSLAELEQRVDFTLEQLCARLGVPNERYALPALS